MSRAGLLVAVAWLGACGGHAAPPEAPPDAPPAAFSIPPAGVDILFVVSNSDDTQDKQTVIAQNLPAFASALEALPGGAPDYHIGVVTTTVAIDSTLYEPSCGAAPNDDGRLQNTPRVSGCTPPSDRYITPTNFGSQRLEDALACIMQVGTGGCGFGAPLEAMKRALDGSHAENAGFRRDGAALVVVIVADEDDCSVADPALFSLPNDQVGGRDTFRCTMFGLACDAPISGTAGGTYHGCVPSTGSYLSDTRSYIQFLETVVDPSQLLVEVISGDASATINTGPLVQNGDTLPLALQPTCTATINGNSTTAVSANRLADVTTRLGAHGHFDTICQSDYSAVLQNLVAKMAGP